jgi:hypothetical protein
MGELTSRAKDRATAGTRRLVVTLGVERWCKNRTALAVVLNKNPDVVSWWAGEGVRRKLEDEDFAAELDRVDEELSGSETEVKDVATS